MTAQSPELSINFVTLSIKSERRLQMQCRDDPFRIIIQTTRCIASLLVSGEHLMNSSHDKVKSLQRVAVISRIG